jgi:hypothetical protein
VEREGSVTKADRRPKHGKGRGKQFSLELENPECRPGWERFAEQRQKMSVKPVAENRGAKSSAPVTA